MPPANDAWAGRIALAGAAGTWLGTNADATVEAGEQDVAVYGGTAAATSIWFSWTAPAAGRYMFDTIGSDFDTLLDAFTGGSLAGLVSIAASDACDWTYMPSRIIVDVAAGTVLSVRVCGWGGQTGNVRLNWGPAPVPANDDWAGRAALVEGANNGSNIGASAEAGEDAMGYGANSVYWSFTPGEDGIAVIDTFGSEPDAYLSVWTGASAAGLVLVADDNGSQYDSGSGYWWSKAVVPVQAGVEYTVRFQGYDDDQQGAVRVNLALPVVPPNDDVADAVVLTPGWTAAGASGVVRGNLAAATVEPDGDNFYFSPQPGTQSVWYKLALPVRGKPRIEVDGGMAGAQVAYGTPPYMSPWAHDQFSYFGSPVIGGEPGYPAYFRVFGDGADAFTARWSYEKSHVEGSIPGFSNTWGPYIAVEANSGEVDLAYNAVKGNTLLALFVSLGAHTVTPPAGWEEVYEETVALGGSQTASARVTIFARRAEATANFVAVFTHNSPSPTYLYWASLQVADAVGPSAVTAQAAGSAAPDFESPSPSRPPGAPVVEFLVACAIDVPVVFGSGAGRWKTDNTTYTAGPAPYLPFPDSDPYPDDGPNPGYQYFALFSWRDNWEGPTAAEGFFIPPGADGQAVLALAVVVPLRGDALTTRRRQVDHAARRRQLTERGATPKRRWNAYD